MQILIALIIFVLLAWTNLLIPAILGSIAGLSAAIIIGILCYSANRDHSVTGVIFLLTIYIVIPVCMMLGIVISGIISIFII